MLRRTVKQRLELINEIGRLYGLGYRDDEIMTKLSLRQSTYYYYKAQLMKQHAEQFSKLSPEDMGYHKDLLREKLAKDCSKLEAYLNKAIQSSDPLITKDIAAIATILLNYRINLLKLESESIAIARYASQQSLPKQVTEYRGSLQPYSNDGLQVLQEPSGPQPTEYSLSQRKFG